MESRSVPNLAAATERLDKAHTYIKEAVLQILRPREAEPLWEVAVAIGRIADEFRAGRQLGGLRVALVSSKLAAKALGASRSPKKLAALEKARQALAAKRQIQAERRMIRNRVAKHTSHPV